MTPEDIEAASAAKYKAPRVTLDDIENAIASETYVTADQFLHTNTEWRNGANMQIAERHAGAYTICMMTLHNGWVVIGGSAPASPANFDPEYGRKLAREQCIKQLWPLMGFALKDKIMSGVVHVARGDIDDGR